MVTNAPVNLLLKKLQNIDLAPTDIHNIEYLEDHAVLNRLMGGFKWLKKNNKSDMILYLQTFAALLEEKLTEYTNISDVLQASAKQAYSNLLKKIDSG